MIYESGSRQEILSSYEQADNVRAVVDAAETMLTDTGYANGATVQKRQRQGVEVLVALGRQTENGHKLHDFRPVVTELVTKTPAQNSMTAF